jgi:DNA gyrase subunit A
MDIGTVESVDIDQQMRAAYLDYAMSVIVARALPDARDGLKPVHRRILYAMDGLGLRSNLAHKKSARIVGEVLGKYHPHGESAVYDALARLAQDFSIRYLLVDGQGNFGSIDGDAPAAMRYTEARLSAPAEELLADLDQDTVDFSENFDGTLSEPAVLPARLPNLLLNGSAGIAVGMATNIPPHNLGELVNALVYLIDQHARLDEIPSEELLQFVPGPDFPTGGIIVGGEGIHQAYSTGRGRLIVRGRAHIEELGATRHRIVLTEIPYQLNKTTLLERIAELARDGRLDEVSDLRDESDRRGMSIIIELKRGAQPKKVLNQLYKYTPLQTTFGVQLLALVEGEPRLISLKRALQIFLEHRQEVITRRARFELEKARARAHILAGLLIALANLDAVIDTIRNSPSAEAAHTRLMERFNLTNQQAQAILDMQLRRLAALERQKIQDEMAALQARIAYLESLLSDPALVLAEIRADLLKMAEKYGDARRTHITAEAARELHIEDLVPDEAVLISMTQRGYIKRTAAKAFRTQARGGRGVTGHQTRQEDEVLALFPARTLDTLLFFTDKGKVYSEKTYQIPDAERAGRGIPIVNVLALEPGETVTAAVAVPQFDSAAYCTMATLLGRVKRVALSEFAALRPSGVIAITLEAGDELGWVRLTNGESELILVSEQGQALRFEEEAVRAMGRAAAGVTGMRLEKGDRLASMEVIEPGGSLVVITTLGYGKRTSLEEYPGKGRATGGVATMDQKSLGKIGRLAAARVVQESDDLTIISRGGVTLRNKVNAMRSMGRAARGVRLMDLAEGDTVASLARMAAADLRQAGVKENGEPPPPA